MSEGEVRAREAAAYWRGIAEGKVEPPAKEQEGNQPASPEQQIAALRGARVLLAEKLDAGELTNAEYQRQVIHLDERLDEIRTGLFKGMVEAGKTETHQEISQRDASAQFQQIEADYPVTKLLTSTALEEFVPQAREALAADGVVLTPDSQGRLPAAQQLALARAIAPLAQDKYAPMLKGSPGAESSPGAGAGTETGKGTTDSPKKPDLPPDLGGTGEVKLGVIEGGLSEKSVMEMVEAGNEDGLEKLIRENPAWAERYAIGG